VERWSWDEAQLAFVEASARAFRHTEGGWIAEDPSARSDDDV
jgi:hypothetical protein